METFESLRGAVSADDGIPVSEPATGEVLVKVVAAALNPFGYKSMAGPMSWMRKVPSESRASTRSRGGKAEGSWHRRCRAASIQSAMD